MKNVLIALASLPFTAMAATELIPNTLPSGYRQVEYVSFPSGAYVDTGLKLSNVQITVKFEVPSTYYNNMSLFGTSYGGKAIHLTQYNHAWYWGTSGVEKNSSATCPWKAGVHELVYAERGTGNVTLDGQIIGGDSSVNDTKGYKLQIGARGESEASRTFVGKIYSFSITDSDGLAVMDLVPALRERDGLGGFYDRVSGRFFGSGAGRFSVALTHLEYERVEGVHVSTGTCFDTGLAVTNCQITMDYRKDGYVSGCNMFGCGGGAACTQFTEYQYKYAIGGYDASSMKSVERMSAVISPWTTGRHRLVYSRNGSERGDVVLDGAVIQTDTVGHNSAGHTLVLCARQWQDASKPYVYSTHPSKAAKFEGEIYSFAATNRQGVALMELVPCRRKATGEVGFYDRVRSRFIRAWGDGVPGASEDVDSFVDVPYLTFTEGAYIDLGFAVTNVQITMKYNAPYVSNRHMFGQSYAASYLSWTEYKNKWYWGAAGKEQNSGTATFSAGILKEIVYSQIGTSNVIVNGTVVGTAGENTTHGCNLRIGSRGKEHNFAGDVYYFTVTNHEGTAVADLIPRCRLSDRAVGLYDRVSGRFYTNANTSGTITAALPTALYEEAECVEFPVTGICLDTGVAVQTNDEVTLRFEMEYSNNRHVLGQEIGASFLHFTACADKWYWGCGENGGESNSGSIAWSGGVHTLVYQQKDTANVVLDGLAIGVAEKAHTCDRPLLIGSRGGDDNFVGKIYSLAVTNNATGACVLDLRPCVRRVDGKRGFFDARTGRFLTATRIGYKTSDSAAWPTSDFNKLYYLRTNGARVDTRLFASNALRIKADFRTTEPLSDQVLYGACGYGYDCCCSNVAARSVFLVHGNGMGSGDQSDTRYVVDAGRASGTVNGSVLYENASASAESASSEALQLFAAISTVKENFDRRRFVGKVYGFEAFENGTRVRACVPAQKISTGEVGLFDKVSGVFFNAQDGVFSAGPESQPGETIFLR